MNETIEQSRVRLAEEGNEPWMLLGPCLSERAWATELLLEWAGSDSEGTDVWPDWLGG